ncbi:MAG: aryl-sulfate sulfotransferase [Deltaproteobacteria bacterium]|nr:aryl-sulfate sulfotransferase [Deltaproteobacteria bacterium]
MKALTKTWISLALVPFAPGCADDGAAADEAGASSSSSSDGGSETATTTASTTMTSATTTSADSSSSAADSSSGVVPIEVEAEITTYDGQPMVADLVLTLSAAGSASVAHATDQGVVIAATEGGDDTHLHFRVRGLAPATMHTLQFEVAATEGGAATSGEVEFETPAALNGFVGAFALETSDVEPAPLFRMSDWNPWPAGDFAGAIMIDPAGITRWYLSAPTTLVGPPAVWVAVRLRADGTILGISGDTFWIRDELGNVLTEIHAVDLGLPTLHHDVIELSNGNFMAISQDFRDVDYPDLGTRYTVGDTIVEFTLDGDVVWSWNSFDHLDPQRRRENGEDLIVNPVDGESALDWTHANAVLLDETTGVITMSLRHQDWIIAIDYATGDVLWRLGDEGDFALDGGDTWFFHQHAPQWQDDGTLLLFDNGNGNPYISPLAVETRAVRYALDDVGMTASVAWEDDEPPFQVIFAGDADRIAGGHLLVTDAAIFGAQGQVNARVRELDESHDPTRIWSFTTPDNRWIYRTTANDRLVGVTAR